jgi:hypothetical protein
MVLSFSYCLCSCHLVSNTMRHQTSFKDFSFKSFPVPLPLQLYTLSQAFYKDTICNTWIPRDTFFNWNVEELHFFKLHYVNVRNADFETYICPVSQLTANTAAIVAMNLSVSDFFADMIYQNSQKTQKSTKI